MYFSVTTYDHRVDNYSSPKEELQEGKCNNVWHPHSRDEVRLLRAYLHILSEAPRAFAKSVLRPTTSAHINIMVMRLANKLLHNVSGHQAIASSREFEAVYVFPHAFEQILGRTNKIHVRLQRRKKTKNINETGYGRHKESKTFQSSRTYF